MADVVYVAVLWNFLSSGRIDKFCLECSADLATAILLSSEIDAATLAGRNTNALVSEFADISGRMLDRAQSAELGFS